MTTNTLRFFCAALLISALAACEKPKAPEPPAEPAQPAQQAALRFGVLPAIDAAATERHYKDLAAGLSKALGREVEIKVAEGYHTLHSELDNGKLDIAQLSAYLYVLLGTDDTKHDVLVQERMTDGEKYRGVFVVKEDSKVKSLADLKGKKFAFVNPASSGGYYYPRMKLRASGIDPDKHFGETTFAGSHTAVAEQVSSGKVDGGALSWWSLPDAKGVRVLDRTEQIPDDVIVASKAVPAKLRAEAKKFFLAAHEDAGLVAFRNNRGLDKYVVPNFELYKPLAGEVLSGK